MWVAEGRGRQGGEGKQISNNDMPCVGERNILRLTQRPIQVLRAPSPEGSARRRPAGELRADTRKDGPMEVSCKSM